MLYFFGPQLLNYRALISYVQRIFYFKKIDLICSDVLNFCSDKTSAVIIFVPVLRCPFECFQYSSVVVQLVLNFLISPLEIGKQTDSFLLLILF